MRCDGTYQTKKGLMVSDDPGAIARWLTLIVCCDAELAHPQHHDCSWRTSQGGSVALLGPPTIAGLRHSLQQP